MNKKIKREFQDILLKFNEHLRFLALSVKTSYYMLNFDIKNSSLCVPEDGSYIK